ncbi:MAG: DNA polymerase III subunit delta [Clostridia bacterium]|nr:DNA polymerase III subunit delta [Clostridia bacterium]
MKQEALRALRERVLEPGLEDLNGVTLDNPGADQLIEACETVPVLSDRRLVVVRDFAGFRTKKAKGNAEAGKTDQGEEEAEASESGDGNAAGKEIAAFLPRLPMSTVLVFAETGRVNKTTSLYKAVVKNGQEVSCDKLKGEALAGWIVERFRREGKLCPRSTAHTLIFVSGAESSLLEGEILKLCAYVGSREGITEDDVREAASASAEFSVFRMLDEVVSGSEARALELLHRMLVGGESPVGILAMLLRQYRLLQMILIMRSDRLSPEEMGQRTGLSGFPLEQYLKQAAIVKAGEVKFAVRLLVSTEYAFKTGRLPEKGLAETAVLELLELRHRYRGK